MEKMKKSEMLLVAKQNAVTPFAELLENANAEQVGDFSYAIPVTVGGMERWVRIDFTAKDTMTDDNGDKVAYDPFIEQSRWEFDKEVKARAKAERERKHAETVAKAKAKKEAAKAKAEAKKAAAQKILGEADAE